jgi:hypothetical protein
MSMLLDLIMYNFYICVKSCGNLINVIARCEAIQETPRQASPATPQEGNLTTTAIMIFERFILHT